ncbi:hypothetical protein E1294_04755 [Nonomuraea diastatica]|uniref:Uncharacterized protein n=1 Tax=Nonomuraea diastatica TaxID=1848329 RepID=A0A4R4X3C6_9ACTN|nr:hypothetical protein E1294_04755 [Nonomuraea diastatica]
MIHVARVGEGLHGAVGTQLTLAVHRVVVGDVRVALGVMQADRNGRLPIAGGVERGQQFFQFAGRRVHPVQELRSEQLLGRRRRRLGDLRGLVVAVEEFLHLPVVRARKASLGVR